MSNEENLNETEAEVPASDSLEKEADTPATDTPDADTSVNGETDQNANADTAEDTSDSQAKDEAKSDAKDNKKKPAKKQGGISKLFKRIYYPVLAVFVALMLVFSVIDGVFGYSPKAYDGDYYTAVNAHVEQLSEFSRSAMTAHVQGGDGLSGAQKYITDTLTAGGFTLKAEEKTNNEVEDVALKTVTEWATSSGNAVPTVTRHTATPSAELQYNIGVEKLLAGHEITNIVAAIPSGKENAGAVVITVRYDSRTDTYGAADNAAFVANALQGLIEFVKAGTKFDNDIVVVFTEELDYAFGAYTFFDSFEGLNSVASRAKYGISLDAYGNAGTLALTDVSGAGLDYINAVCSVSGSSFNSSIVEATLPENLVNDYAVKAFGDVPAVQIAVFGGLDAAQSFNDTAENLSQAIVRQQSAFFKNFVSKFGNADKTFGDATENNVFFSYLDGGTVSYNSVAAYVVGALILVLLGVTIAMMIVKKVFSLKNMLIAVGVELLVVVSSVIALFAAYLLVALMLTGFGVLPIHSLLTVTYFNAGILIAAILLTLAATFGFTVLYKKLFKITASDTVRGTAVLFALCGAIMSFACPAYSFITSWLGLLMLVLMLVTVLTHKAFKGKFGFGMDKLYPYAVPVALCLPLVMSQVSALMWLLPLALLPVIMSVFSGLLGVAVPYLERTQPMLDKLAKKLPMRTQRVERTITERVEDKAKKGRFTERTVRKVENEKVPVNYKNYFGISVVSVLAIVIALFSGGFGVTPDKTLTGFTSYDNAAYNGALVYEWSNSSKQLVIDDLMLYKYARYAIDNLEWDGTRYVKSYSTNVLHQEPKITRNDEVYTVTTYDPRSVVTLTIPSARNISKITVKESSKSGISDYKGYEYEFLNQSTITLRLPYGFGNFTLEFEGATPSRIDYNEVLSIEVGNTSTDFDAIDDWNKLKTYYTDTTIYNNLRGAIVINSEFTNL